MSYYNKELSTGEILAFTNHSGHPINQLNLVLLRNALEQEVAKGYVSKKSHPEYPELCIYNYTDKTTYDRHWTRATLVARGLIMAGTKVVGLSFPKFFNYSELVPEIDEILGQYAVTDVYEKIDGSLVILFYYDNKWLTATRGSFESEQAVTAAKMLEKCDMSCFSFRCSHLFEIVYPENRIVVDYGTFKGLYHLGSYAVYPSLLGEEFSLTTSPSVGPIETPKSYNLTVEETLEKAKGLSINEEGFVLKLENGLRLKIKGDEYIRAHRAIYQATPLNAWRMVMSIPVTQWEETLEVMPEEFRDEFEKLLDYYTEQSATMLSRIAVQEKKCKDMTNKEIGLAIQNNELDDMEVAPWVFAMRQNPSQFINAYTTPGNRYREKIFKLFRPKNNLNPL